jgi:hypothetical protein
VRNRVRKEGQQPVGPAEIYLCHGQPASELLQADAATFNAFAAKVRADLETVFRDYDISDKSTMRDLLYARLNLQQLAGSITRRWRR